MVESRDAASDPFNGGQCSAAPAKGWLGRSAVFVFGVIPSDPWRAPIVVWVMLALGVALMFASYGMRHWGWRPGGVDAFGLAEAASVASSILLLLVTVGLALARARRLMAPSGKADETA